MLMACLNVLNIPPGEVKIRADKRTSSTAFIYYKNKHYEASLSLHLCKVGEYKWMYAKTQLSIYCRTLIKVCAVVILEGAEVSKY